MDPVARQRPRALARTLTGAAAAATVVVLVDYAFGLPLFDRLHAPQDRSPLTVLAILGVAGALVAASHERVRLCGSATRRGLGLLLLPALFGWLLYEATLHAHLGTGPALALLVILTVAPMALLVLRDARAQDELEVERRSGRVARQALERQLARNATDFERESVERAKVEAAMHRSQRVEAIGQLSGGIAHEFNNLLAAIGGNLELLLRKLPEGHAARRHALTATGAVGQGAKLAGRLLAFSCNQRLAIQPTEVSPALMRARELVGKTLGPSIELLLEDSRDPVWARTDPEQLELALVNLAVNAREAMPDGGRLRIRSGLRATRVAGDDRVRDYVSIRVTDTGVGMAPEVLARAVEPFFTTHGRGKGAGLGLGLAQVYGFVRQCGGDLEMQSTPGVGTSVEMLLPRTAPATTPDAARAPATPVARAELEEPRRLLVIDDDDAVRGVLVELLGDAGYAVSAARDGPSALARIDAIRPHAAVIDFLMPGMTGAEVAHRVQAHMPKLPIVFVSGYHDTIALDGIAGAVVLRKPFQGDQLQRAVTAALERRIEA